MKILDDILQRETVHNAAHGELLQTDTVEQAMDADAARPGVDAIGVAIGRRNVNQGVRRRQAFTGVGIAQTEAH